MRPLTVVIAQTDPQAAEFLASSLNPHFRAVSVARSLEELRRAIPKHRADLAVVDLEMATLKDIEELHRQFGAISIVCTHRVPDDELWASALAVGAEDVCQSTDVGGIVHAANREQARANAA